MVERARIVLLKADGQSSREVARQIGRTEEAVVRTVKRFNAAGLEGLADRARSGRPLEYTEVERGRLLATARTLPTALGLPYGYWTLDRLVEYAHTTLAIPISRAHLGRVLEAEGLKWYQEQTYFRERPDPQFAEKRGR
jgi:transposase